jgi:hypothetical protein
MLTSVTPRAYLIPRGKRHLELGIALSTDPTCSCSTGHRGMSPAETTRLSFSSAGLRLPPSSWSAQDLVVMNISDGSPFCTGAGAAEGCPAESLEHLRHRPYLGPPSGPFLASRDLHAYYGESHILQGLSLGAWARWVPLIGRNGAVRPRRCDIMASRRRALAITFDGRSGLAPPAQFSVDPYAVGGLLLPNLSVGENLRWGCLGAGVARGWRGLFENIWGPSLACASARAEGKWPRVEHQILAIARGLFSSPS